MAPPFRTIKHGDRLLSWRDWGVAYVGTVISVLAPALVIWLFAILPGMPQSVRDGALAIAGVLLFAPFLTLWLAPIGLLIGAVALRLGLAGWGTAILASFLPAALMFAPVIATSDFEPVLLYGIIGAPLFAWHALAMWWITRWRKPAAFAPRGAH